MEATGLQKILKVLTQIFYIVLLIVPVLLALVGAQVYAYQIYAKAYVMPALCALAILLCLIGLCRLLAVREPGKLFVNLFFPLFVFCLALGLRLWAVFALGEFVVPISDYQTAYNTILNGGVGS